MLLLRVFFYFVIVCLFVVAELFLLLVDAFSQLFSDDQCRVYLASYPHCCYDPPWLQQDFVPFWMQIGPLCDRRDNCTTLFNSRTVHRRNDDQSQTYGESPVGGKQYT